MNAISRPAISTPTIPLQYQCANCGGTFTNCHQCPVQMTATALPTSYRPRATSGGQM